MKRVSNTSAPSPTKIISRRSQGRISSISFWGQGISILKLGIEGHLGICGAFSSWGQGMYPPCYMRTWIYWNAQGTAVLKDIYTFYLLCWQKGFSLAGSRRVRKVGLFNKICWNVVETQISNLHQNQMFKYN